MKIGLMSLAIATGIAAVAGANLIKSNAPEATIVSVAQGMTAVLDEENGGFRTPTAKEAAKFKRPAKPKATRATVVRRADGSESLKVDSSYMSFSTATRNEDGSLAQKCGVNHDHATHNAAPASKAVK